MKRFAIRCLAMVMCCTMLFGFAPSSVLADEAERITVVTLSMGEIPRDFDEVVAALNTLTREKIGIEADIQMVNLATYTETINVMQAGGDPMDLFWLPVDVSLSTLVAQKQVAPVDELLEQYGQGILEALGQLIHYAPINGKTYAIPFNGNKAYTGNIVCRKDICDKYGINLDEITSYEDLGAVFEIIRTNEPDLVPLVPENRSVIAGYNMIGTGITEFDALGDSLGVLMNGKGFTVQNLFETDEYKQLLDTLHDWYVKGYIMQDAATTSEVGSVMYLQGKAFAYMNIDALTDNTKAIEHIGITNQGIPTYAKALTLPIITSKSGFFSMGLNSRSSHKEAAIKWLNLFYTDKDAVNLIYNGIEGKHYVKNENGTISRAEGQEGAASGWDTPFCWMFGNSALAYTFATESDDPDFRAKFVAQNKAAQYSPAFGFTFDIEPVKIEYSAVSNVLSKYRVALETGSVDPADVLGSFLMELESAGVNTILEEKQRQLDAWVAQNAK